MARSRTLTALAGLLVSLAVSVVAWMYFDTLVVFLVLPFVPLLFRGLAGDDESVTVHRCPECDFSTRNPEFTHCPYDGEPLATERRGG